MSLTSSLAQAHSPISRFLSKELPAVASLIGDFRSQLPLATPTVTPQPPGPFSYGTLGQAIDLRLRIAFGTPVGSALSSGILLTAMDMAGARSAEAGKAVAEAGKELLRRLEGQLPASPGAMLLKPADEEQVARLCFAAGWFEEVFRSQLHPKSPLLQADLSRGLDGLLDQVPGYVAGDIAALVSLADHPKALQGVLRLPAAQRVCGPVFAGSGHVGGADADFIAAGNLIDCKATIHPKRIGRPQFYQLAGYLLLDYDDSFKIGQVSLYLARQGRLIGWSTQEFLRLLGARRPLPELREACRSALSAPDEVQPLVLPRQLCSEQETLFDGL